MLCFLLTFAIEKESPGKSKSKTKIDATLS